jgi:hypothetical protein
MKARDNTQTHFHCENDMCEKCARIEEEMFKTPKYTPLLGIRNFEVSHNFGTNFEGFGLSKLCPF